MVVSRVYHSCFTLFMGFQIWVDLILLDMMDFDIIQGMTRLNLYHNVLKYNANNLTLAMNGADKLEQEGVYKANPVKIIYFICASRKGMLNLIAYHLNVSVGSPFIKSVSVVLEFQEVFPINLIGMPLDSNHDFCIDMDPDTHPIFISSLYMVPIELKELKT